MLGLESDVKGVSGPGALHRAETEAGTSADVKTTADDNVGKGEKTVGGDRPTGFDKLKAKPDTKTTDVPVETPAFQPNFKFKVLDKEHEVDEFLRPVIKDAETEKKIKELYEKAFGLDSVKQDRQTLKTELSEAKERIAATDRALDTLNQYAVKNDWDSFFGALKIPTDRILAYAVDLVKRQQDPQYAAQVERQRQENLTRDTYEAQNRELMESNRQLSVQQRTLELDVYLQRPDVSTIAQTFDTGMGSPGAFKDQVIRIGQAYAASGRDISVQDAVAEAVRIVKAANPTIGQPTQTPQTPVVVSQQQKPTIPVVQGRGASPVKSTYKSIDDLKRRAKELESYG